MEAAKASEEAERQRKLQELGDRMDVDFADYDEAAMASVADVAGLGEGIGGAGSQYSFMDLRGLDGAAEMELDDEDDELGGGREGDSVIGMPGGRSQD